MKSKERGKDMENIELIFQKYYKYVKSYSISLCFDEYLAEEITQETFYKALINIDKFRNECQMETWLCKIAKNEFLSLKRKEKNLQLNQEIIPTFDDFVVNLENREQAKIVLEYATELESPYKDVFYMRVMGEFSYSVIGEVFSKSENWARVTYYRARQKIAERMKNNE